MAYVVRPSGRSVGPDDRTVMRPSTLRAYAIKAGFEDVEVLPIENDFFRFHRMRR